MASFTPQNLALYLVDNGIITNTALFQLGLMEDLLPQSNILDPIWMFYECGLQRFIMPGVPGQHRYEALKLFSETCKNASEPQRLAHSSRFYQMLAQLRQPLAEHLPVTTKTDADSALYNPRINSSFKPANENADVKEAHDRTGAIDIQANKDSDSWFNRPCTPPRTAQRSCMSRNSPNSRPIPVAQSARSSASLGAYSSATSSAYNSAVSSMSSTGISISSQKTKEYPAAEWRRRRNEITRLYIDQDMTLKQMQTVMRHNGFDATQRQYKRRFDEWQLRKNVTTEDKLAIIAKQHQRRVLGKRTVFALNGKPMGDSKLRQLLKGIQIDSADLLGERRTPPQVTYFTPSGSNDFSVRQDVATELDTQNYLASSPKDDGVKGGDGVGSNGDDITHSESFELSINLDPLWVNYEHELEEPCLDRMDRVELDLESGATIRPHPLSIQRLSPATFISQPGACAIQPGTPRIAENPMPVCEELGDVGHRDLTFEDIFLHLEEPYPNHNLDWLDATTDST